MSFLIRSALIIYLVWLNLTHSPVYAQSAYLLADRVFEGDIAELVIEYDNKIPSLYALDTSQLQSDFEVLEIRPRVSRVFESNEVFNRMQWQIELLPRRNGRLSIPPLKLGDISTPPLILDVEPLSSTSYSNQKVFIEIAADPLNPYPGQQTRIIMRLFQNIPLSDAEFSEPEATDGDIYRGGKDAGYSITRDGTRFKVTERLIAFVARSPGKIEVSPAVFRGRIRPEREFSETDFRTHPRLIYRRSEALKLQVREFPPGFDEGNWLPARQLEISQLWSDSVGELKVGDSLDLTLSIEARGLAAEVLPVDLIAIDSSKIKIYPDQAKRSNRFDGRDLVGRLDQRFAVVLIEPGEINIPDLKLKWWDVKENIIRVAVVEGRVLKVIGAQHKLSSSDEAVTQLRPQDPQSMRITLNAMRNNWWFGLLAVAILLCSGILLGIRPLRSRLSLKIAAVLATYRAYRSLQQACLSNDALSSRRELINWGRLHWPSQTINGMHGIAASCKSSELIEELLKLDAALYADDEINWQGQRLWRLISKNRQRSTTNTVLQRSLLPEFYPRQC